LKLIKSEDLDPNRNYIFGYHPHGAFSFGAAGNFLTDATHFSTLFPNIRPHLMMLRLNFSVPLIRELYLNLGACCVSRDSINYFLSGQQGQGHAVVIVTGGMREQNLTKNDTMILYLKKRQGFIKLALENG
jgi:2-acylglycerol O-acyltransferase 2